MTTTSSKLRVLGFSGSLRKGSFNTMLLRQAITIADEQKLPLTIDVADIHDIPLYNDDVRAAGWPAPVQRLRDATAQAEAILFVTPEYNYSVPGVLKNAIDWVSRPPSQPFAGKPFAVMGASGGMSGTMRAQYHLRQIAVFLDMHALNKPEVFVRNGKDAFDDNGALKDETTKKLVADLLGNFAAWSQKFRS